MQTILAKLAEANISQEDLDSIKEAFETAVKHRVDEQSKIIADKADEYCRIKIDEAVKLKTAQLEAKANTYCEKKAATIARKADIKINEQIRQMEKLTQQYINEYFNEKFQEKYGEELQAIEEKVIVGLDKYLEYAINEKISPALINKTAINETFAPIVKGIQSLFEEQYVPLNVSGTKKLKEAQRKVAELTNTLKEQVNENIRLSETAEKAAKAALIAEKTEGMTEQQKNRIKSLCESKSYSSTKQEIDQFVNLVNEVAEVRTAAKPTHAINEQIVTKTMRRRPVIEDGLEEFTSARFKKIDESTQADDFLLNSANYLED